MAVEWDLKGGGWDGAKNDLDAQLGAQLGARLEKRNVKKIFIAKDI